MSEMVSDDELVQTAPRSWTDRWVDIESSIASLQMRRIEIAQAGPPSIVERKAEPVVSPHLMLMALITIAIATTLTTIEFLFRRTVRDTPCDSIARGAARHAVAAQDAAASTGSVN